MGDAAGGFSPDQPVAPRSEWPFLGGVIFLAHPLQVESVAWVSQRKTLLAMFFFLGSFLFYVEYRRRGLPTGRRSYILAVASFVLALLAKSVAVILPLVLVWYDLCFPREGKRSGLITDKVPFLAVALGCALLAVRSQSPEFDGGRAPFHGGSPLATFFTMLPVMASYLGLLSRPVHLSAMYAPAIKTGIDGEVVTAALLLLLLVALGVYLWSTRRPFCFWYGVFWLGFLPVVQIVPLVTLMNDRYCYFPLMGAAACWGGVTELVAVRKGAAQRFLLVVLVAPLVVLPLLAWQRTAVWKDSLSLWSDAVVASPASSEAWFNLGETWYQLGRRDEALASYRRALTLDPSHQHALNNSAVILMERGELLPARPLLLQAVVKNPRNVDALLNLGDNYRGSGELAPAEDAYRKALEVRPASPKVLRRLGAVSLQRRDLTAARSFYGRATAAGGPVPDVSYDLACIEALEGHTAAALQHLEDALRQGYADRENLLRDPDLASVRGNPRFKELMDTYFSQRSDR
jgi:protein O-mannosyl-transferase